VGRGETAYNRAAGPVRVARRLYRSPRGGRAICPLELRAGMREGYWTPLAAQQATWAVSPLTSQAREALFDLSGTRTPSQSPRERLPQAWSVQWEAQRPPCEDALRTQETVPPAAVSLAGSLEGVMAPMQEGKRQAKRQDALSKGRLRRCFRGLHFSGAGLTCRLYYLFPYSCCKCGMTSRPSNSSDRIVSLCDMAPACASSRRAPKPSRSCI
jgi:hypothetical protein